MAARSEYEWFRKADLAGLRADSNVVPTAGSVPSQHDRRRAAIAAWSHPGVWDVVNDITVA
jgi:hypothetical protein